MAMNEITDGTKITDDRRHSSVGRRSPAEGSAASRKHTRNDPSR